ncbi:hypothetical protein RvY_12893 [Ramazzottius varieornatus]|uniref:Uncharacterized protein n=1 Tax=Ramazzottius varieornatus TaxID=947166 RepID=A0A1D1VRF4_RAMVA|nr:hypothetical protein RvY_12893 [Ramazzottius varieornatus]
MGDDIMDPLCQVVVAEGQKLREEEARTPLSFVPNFYIGGDLACGCPSSLKWKKDREFFP